MELETVKNAMSRELDWDNYLICGVGDLSATYNASSGSITVIDMNGDTHTLSAEQSFAVDWKIPKRGRLFSVGQNVTGSRPHYFGNGHSAGHKLTTAAVMGCCKTMHLATAISNTTAIFILTDADNNAIFYWDSPAMWRTSDSGGGAVASVPLSYELGVECDVGMSLSTSYSYNLVGEPSVSSIGAIMFVPYKE